MAVQPPPQLSSTETIPRSSSAPVQALKRINHDAKNKHPTSGTCCSGHGGHHGCGCGCRGCLCRLTHFFKDESNSETYGGEGGRPGMPSPDVDLPDHGARRFDSSSLSSATTSESRFLSDGSFDNSYEVPGQLNGHHLANVNVGHTRHPYSASEEEEEEDGHHAWARFGVSPANSLDHICLDEEDEDSSGMVIPGIMDDSDLGVPRRSGSSIDLEQSIILNSDYEASWARGSATASDILNGAGAAFDHFFVVRPLRLTPDCRHTVHQPICSRCAH